MFETDDMEKDVRDLKTREMETVKIDNAPWEVCAAEGPGRKWP